MVVGAVLLALSQARGGTVDTFTITNTSTTAANDITIGFKQSITQVGPNQILDNTGANTGNTWTYSQATSTQTSLKFTEPAAGSQDVDTNESFKIKVTSNAVVIRVDPSVNLTFFTDNNNRINNSAKLVSADIQLNQDPNTGVATVSTGNSTADYVFLTGIRVWTGLTYAQVTNYDSTGDLITSGLGSPVLTPSDITIAPNSTGPTVSLGTLPFNGSWVLFLYNLSSGPSASIGSATNYGQAEFASQTIPEPPALMLLATGVVGLLAHLGCHRGHRSSPAAVSGSRGQGDVRE